MFGIGLAGEFPNVIKAAVEFHGFRELSCSLHACLAHGGLKQFEAGEGILQADGVAHATLRKRLNQKNHKCSL